MKLKNMQIWNSFITRKFSDHVEPKKNYATIQGCCQFTDKAQLHKVNNSHLEKISHFRHLSTFSVETKPDLENYPYCGLKLG